MVGCEICGGGGVGCGDVGVGKGRGIDGRRMGGSERR